MKQIITWTALVVAAAVVVGCSSTSQPSSVKAGSGASSAAPSGKKGTPAPKPGSPSDTADETNKTPKLNTQWQGVTITWEDKGQKSMVASALEVTGDTSAGTAVMKKVNARLYSQGKATATLQAPNVLADKKTGVVTATGGVTITSLDPKSTIKTIKAQWVKWISRENKIVGDGGVKARGSMASIDAAAFTADTALRTIRILADPAEARAVIEKH